MFPWSMCFLTAAAFVPAVMAATNYVGMATGPNRFVPSVINIVAGDTVIWTNTGFVQHTVTPTNNNEGFCGTRLLTKCETTFNQPGSFRYFCIPHFNPPFQNMTGVVVVASPANVPPTIAITSPQNGASFGTPASFQFSASANDSNGSVTKVDFFVNGALAGTAGNASAPNFSITVPALDVGSYTLDAIAMDDDGATNAAAPVSIMVLPHYSLAISASPANAGTVVADPPQPETGFESNTVVTLTALPTNGFVFTNWSGDVSSTSAQVTITMNGDKTAVANFARILLPRYRLAVLVAPTNSGHVLVTPSADSNDTYAAETTIALAAEPARGFQFARWIGTAESNNNPLVIVLTNDALLTAEFERAPITDFDDLSGGYSGLLLDPQSVNHAASGPLNIRVARTGSYRGFITLGGAQQNIAGQFDRFGYAPLVLRRGTLSGSLQLEADADRITGTLTDGTLFPSLLLYRPASPTNTAVLEGTYALTLGTNAPITTESTATMIVAASGLVRVRGTLADGTRFTERTILTPDVRVPLSVILYGHSGSLMGWLNIATNFIVEGTLHWSRPADSRSHDFPAGFAIQVPVTGARQ